MLKVFQENPKTGLSVSEVMAATGLPGSTVHNVTDVFTVAGWLSVSWRTGAARKARRPVKCLRLTALGTAAEWGEAPTPITMDGRRADLMRELLRWKEPHTVRELAEAMGISIASASSRLRAIRSCNWLDLSWADEGDTAALDFHAGCRYQLNADGVAGAREALRLYRSAQKRAEEQGTSA
uniref:helix-turn-helix domain-containing protein n=1 Tax=Lentzea alba TaxID=2714351 RepID=UPI0039BFAD2F